MNFIKENVYHSLTADQHIKTLPDFPLHIDLELNSQCNFGCSYCPQSETPEKQGFKQGKMDLADAIKIVKFCAQNGTKTIKLFWRGEPTINPDTPLVLRYAKECGLFTMLNTNGSFPLKNIQDYLDDIDWISFSIDDHHISKKGGVPNSQSGLIIDNLLLMKEKSKAHVQVQSGTPHKWWEEFCLTHKIEYSPDAITKRTEKGDYDFIDLGKKPRKNCGFPSWRMIITWDLKVKPCCVAWKDSELNMGQIDIGNLETIKEIWINQTYRELRRDQKTLVFMQSACKSCVSPSAYVL